VEDLTMRALAPITIAILLALPGLAAGEEPPAHEVKDLIESIGSPDAGVRSAARAEAPRVGAPAVMKLAALIDEGRGAQAAEAPDRQRREVALTARSALERIVHHAGRPGADAERRAVAAELARALDAARTPKEKRELLHLTAFIGADPEVAAVARLLDDEDGHVRETARLALERIPGGAAVQALIAAARKAGDDRKPDLVFSIGKKGDGAASGFLIETARAGSGPVRLAAFQSLSRLGTADAAAAFEETLARQDLPERAPIVNEYLRWADRRLEASPGAADARKAYGWVLASAPLEHQRERAILALSSEPFGSIDALVAGLSDAGERVRRSALRRLSEMKDSAATEALRKAYGEGRPEARPAILRALAAKDAALAEPLIREAAAGRDPELRITALDIQGALGDPAMEPVYLEVVRSGSPSVRPIALRGYLAIARKRLEAGEKDSAFAMYGRALEASSGLERGDVLGGLIESGGTKAIDQVAGLLRDPGLAAEAARKYVDLATSLGKAGEVERAAKILIDVVKGDFAGDLQSKALAGLREIGRDPQDAARDDGFLVDWWVVGPMQDREGNGLERKYFPEDGIDLEKEHSIGARRYRWKPLDMISLDGKIQLGTAFRRSENVLAYAFAEVDCASPAEVIFKMGSDEGIACWVNGERIHLKDTDRSLTVDEDSVPAKLVAGRNRILLKVRNSGGDWSFAFRITDPAGKPLALPVTSRESSRRPSREGPG
jgi:hypothetical protein